MELPKYYYDPIFGPLIKEVIRIVDDAMKQKCSWESAESTYGCGDSQPCGRDAIRNEDGQARCEKHHDD